MRHHRPEGSRRARSRHRPLPDGSQRGMISSAPSSLGRQRGERAGFRPAARRGTLASRWSAGRRAQRSCQRRRTRYNGGYASSNLLVYNGLPAGVRPGREQDQATVAERSPIWWLRCTPPVKPSIGGAERRAGVVHRSGSVCWRSGPRDWQDGRSEWPGGHWNRPRQGDDDGREACHPPVRP